MAHGIVRRSDRKPFRVVCIEGNIGCGKTTFLRYLSRVARPGFVTKSEEPIHKWRNFKYTTLDGKERSENLLGLLYEDPKRWCFAFNYHVLQSRLQTHKRAVRSGVGLRLMERSVYSNYHCFVRNSLACGDLTEEEHTVLRAHFDLVTKSHNLLSRKRGKHRAEGQVDSESSDEEEEQSPRLVDLFVYLRVPPEVCQQRMKKRGRDEEEGVPLGFLRQLHCLHDDFFLTDSGFTEDGTPVLVIDNLANDSKTAEKQWEQYLNRILYGDDVRPRA